MKPKRQRKIIRKIQKKLDLDMPINIVDDCDIRVWTDYEEIYISSGAINQMDIDEIAFAIAHEDAHITSKHKEQKSKIIDSINDEVRQIMRTDKGLGKKLIGLVGLGITGTAAFTLARQAQEIDADVKAKLKLKESVFDEEAGESFFKKINHGVSMSHPSSNLRSEILKLIK